MKTIATLRTALPLTLAGVLFACASPATATAGDPTGADQNDTSTPPPNTSTTPAAPPAAPAPPAATPAPVAVPAIATAKVHPAPIFSYAIDETYLWVATDVAVERNAPDGTNVQPVPDLAAGFTLASDGARIYAFLDNGDSAELYSMKNDGTDGQHHFNWSFNNGSPSALTVHAGRTYFTSTRSDHSSQSAIVSASAVPAGDGSNLQTQVEDYVDAQATPPAFGTDRLFSVDYYRQSAAMRVTLGDSSKSIDVIHAEVPSTAAGIAMNATDVYTRTAQGIVKVAIGSGDGTDPVVVVPSVTCSIFDPADGSESVLDDALVLDGTSIYTACRNGANVEVRAYDLNGALLKVVAAAPYTGGLSHVRVTSTAVYWLNKVDATSGDDELWRAAK
jgi:hypothetical protein